MQNRHLRPMRVHHFLRQCNCGYQSTLLVDLHLDFGGRGSNSKSKGASGFESNPNFLWDKSDSVIKGVAECGNITSSDCVVCKGIVMTQEERQMLTDLANKIASTPAPVHDAEAEELIRTKIGSRPDALYLM